MIDILAALDLQHARVLRVSERRRGFLIRSEIMIRGKRGTETQADA